MIDPTGVGTTLAAVSAVKTGDVEGLRRLLAARPDLVGATFNGRDLLHVATDWPGHLPRVAETITVLAGAGADVNARGGPDGSGEAPLHWAASSDDVEAIDALLDAGADIDVPGAVLGGGGPIADAVGFAQWNAARRLVERGAATPLREAAAMGLLDRVAAAWTDPPTQEGADEALWYAAHGGQQEVAEWLLSRGADKEWVAPWDGHTAASTARRNGFEAVAEWLESR